MMMPSIFNENLFDEMMNFPFEDDFFGKRNPLYGKHGRNVMKTDVKEKEDSYEVAVDLPGFKKEEISADLKNGYLTIRAEKGLDKDEDDKNGNFIRRERYYGSCSRSFYVGSGVREEDIKAKFEDGLLKLSIPKMDEKAIESPKRIAIEG